MHRWQQCLRILHMLQVTVQCQVQQHQRDRSLRHRLLQVTAQCPAQQNQRYRSDRHRLLQEAVRHRLLQVAVRHRLLQVAVQGQEQQNQRQDQTLSLNGVIRNRYQTRFVDFLLPTFLQSMLLNLLSHLSMWMQALPQITKWANNHSD